MPKIKWVRVWMALGTLVGGVAVLFGWIFVLFWLFGALLGTAARGFRWALGGWAWPW